MALPLFLGPSWRLRFSLSAQGYRCDARFLFFPDGGIDLRIHASVNTFHLLREPSLAMIPAWRSSLVPLGNLV